ncbi:hypothetical protein VP01_2921g1 [Puccinia sorghi]|uniref:Uncharacterized protein n=1 Tax=Puccinia sorghi TaxID=27349 RepID=A0A0L6V171_9BASI|nr:hypothetical protein VP01_2921g1 [Puccinia sorghi]
MICMKFPNCKNDLRVDLAQGAPRKDASLGGSTKRFLRGKMLPAGRISPQHNLTPRNPPRQHFTTEESLRQNVAGKESSAQQKLAAEGSHVAKFCRKDSSIYFFVLHHARYINSASQKSANQGWQSASLMNATLRGTSASHSVSAYSNQQSSQVFQAFQPVLCLLGQMQGSLAGAAMYQSVASNYVNQQDFLPNIFFLFFIEPHTSRDKAFHFMDISNA